MNWLARIFGRSFVWKLGAIAALAVVGAMKACYAQTIDCSTACTVTVVHELSLPPLQLTAEEGGQIASAVLAVWVVGWAFRLAIRALNSDGKPTNESE